MPPRTGFKVFGVRWLYAFSLAIATVGVGVTADRVTAQVSQVTYYERPISTTIDSGVVSTNSGIGLNVRSCAGLSCPIIGGAVDGAYLRLVGNTTSVDGYTWQQVDSGGWVATDYVNGGGYVTVGYPNNGCWQTVSACNGGSQGRPSQPIDRPIAYPISAGPYIAAVPGGSSTLAQVRRVIPGARLDRAREGSFVNAGSFATYDGAQAMTSLLRTNGMDARVIFAR